MEARRSGGSTKPDQFCRINSNLNWGKAFGVKEELDPVYWTLGAAYGWGALPEKDAAYQNYRS